MPKSVRFRVKDADVMVFLKSVELLTGVLQRLRKQGVIVDPSLDVTLGLDPTCSVATEVAVTHRTLA